MVPQVDERGGRWLAVGADVVRDGAAEEGGQRVEPSGDDAARIGLEGEAGDVRR